MPNGMQVDAVIVINIADMVMWFIFISMLYLFLKVCTHVLVFKSHVHTLRA